MRIKILFAVFLLATLATQVFASDKEEKENTPTREEVQELIFVELDEEGGLIHHHSVTIRSEDEANQAMSDFIEKGIGQEEDDE